MDGMESETINTESIMQERAEYRYGFVTDVETERFSKGLSEEVVRAISKKKEEPEWLLEFRLKAFHKWLEMDEPEWANVN